MPTVSVRKLSILALLAAPNDTGRPNAPVVGTTRLQKLLFLAERSLPKISGDRLIRFDFRFEPYRYGPADLHLYQDLEFLLSLGHVSNVRARMSGSSIPEEASERALSFAYLMGDEDDAELFAEVEGETATWEITSSGERVLQGILAGVEGRARATCDTVVEAMGEAKRAYGSWPLAKLLRYVYSTYPELTTSSEIRDRVLGHE